MTAKNVYFFLGFIPKKMMSDASCDKDNYITICCVRRKKYATVLK